MNWSTYQKTVTSAEVTATIAYVFRTLPTEAKLRVVNVYNEGTGWLQTNIEIMRMGDKDDSAETIALKHRELQRGNKDVHWEGDIELSDDFRKIRGSVENIVTGDVLHITVGYE